MCRRNLDPREDPASSIYQRRGGGVVVVVLGGGGDGVDGVVALVSVTGVS